MRVAIYGRYLKDKDTPFLQEIIGKLHDNNFEVVIHNTFYERIKDHVSMDGCSTFVGYEDIKGDVDFLFSLGGDGTLLDTVSLVRDSEIPVLGINLGRLGFLASTGKDEIDAVIETLIYRTYVLDKRTLIHVDTSNELFGDVNYGLNEFTIHKKDTSSMITINAYINGELLNSYWADGLIVATPTGSTGYSLSCGGPIIFPTSHNFVITPVAPHNLNVRPIVVSSDTILSFEVEGRSDYFLSTIDSRYATIDSSVQLAIRQENFSFHLMRMNESGFLNTIRSKLMWGIDQRN